MSRNQSHERLLEQFNTQLLLGFQSHRGFSIHTGLIYQRNNVRLKYETTFSEDFTDPDGIISIRVDQQGDSTLIRGPVNTTRETNIQVQYHNSYTSFDVPLLLGYQFQLGKIGLQLEAGPIFNISANAKAHLYRGENIFRESTTASGYYRSRIVRTGLQANANLVYPVGSKLELTASARYFRYGDGFVADGRGYQTTFSNVGLNLGWRWRF